jgi:alpha-tubulin suppressor-like RCC1 family protein
VAVVGSLSFSSLSAGSQHTCGITTTGIAYCWGWNNLGQLGDGSRSGIYWEEAYSSVPVKVAGQP